jgi:mono/diheme cytochrome c family protein
MRLARLLAATAILAGCTRGNAGEHRRMPRASVVADTPSAKAAIDSGIVTPREIALGDSVFNGRDGDGMCATCHGPNGEGTKAAPALNDQEWINGDGSIGFIKGTVYQGVPHPAQHPLPMPPLGRTLTERQLQAVAAYVYGLSHGLLRNQPRTATANKAMPPRTF